MNALKIVFFKGIIVLLFAFLCYSCDSGGQGVTASPTTAKVISGPQIGTRGFPNSMLRKEIRFTPPPVTDFSFGDAYLLYDGGSESYFIVEVANTTAHRTHCEISMGGAILRDVDGNRLTPITTVAAGVMGGTEKAGVDIITIVSGQAKADILLVRCMSIFMNPLIPLNFLHCSLWSMGYWQPMGFQLIAL